VLVVTTGGARKGDPRKVMTGERDTIDLIRLYLDEVVRRDVATKPCQRDVDSFDRRARSYEHDWRSQFHAQVVAASAEVALWAMPHPATVLDVGCGTGALLRTLADRLPARVALAGVDPAPASAHPRYRRAGVLGYRPAAMGQPRRMGFT
jgi:2-polyprenyl-3-methyl-5-hydroxy-6-metoxy-1,4-benzoquinol methylase